MRNQYEIHQWGEVNEKMKCERKEVKSATTVHFVRVTVTSIVADVLNVF